MRDLIERLRARTIITPAETVMISIDGGKPVRASTGEISVARNPDGPKATDEIIRLREALTFAAAALRDAGAFQPANEARTALNQGTDNDG